MIRRFPYAWLIVAVTFLVLLAAAGVRAAPGLLIKPLEAEFGLLSPQRLVAGHLPAYLGSGPGRPKK